MKHGSEVSSMLFQEYTMEDMKKMLKEEGIEEGLLLAAKKMINKGTPLEVVSENLEIPKEVIEQYLKDK